MTKIIDALVATICDTNEHPLAPLLRGWCAESRAFVSFAQRYATKIHKKARLARNDATFADLCAELAVVALLVGDQRCAVAYEAYAATGKRGPDLTVVYKTHTPFNIEITHTRLAATADDGAAHKLARVVCNKLGQLRGACANLLVIVVPPEALQPDLVPTTMRLLEAAVQRGDDAFFRLYQLDTLRAFTQQRRRLSAIALRAFTPSWTSVGTTIWTNPQATHTLPVPIVKLFAT